MQPRLWGLGCFCCVSPPRSAEMVAAESTHANKQLHRDWILAGHLGHGKAVPGPGLGHHHPVELLPLGWGAAGPYRERKGAYGTLDGSWSEG